MRCALRDLRANACGQDAVTVSLNVSVFAKALGKREAKQKDKLPDKELPALATTFEVTVLPSRQCTSLTLEGSSGATAVPQLIALSQTRSGQQNAHFELIAYAGSTVDGLTVRASSLAGDLDPSETNVVLVCESHPDILGLASPVVESEASSQGRSSRRSRSSPGASRSLDAMPAGSLGATVGTTAIGGKLPLLHMPLTFEPNRPIFIKAEERNAKERKLIDDRHRGGETAR